MFSKMKNNLLIICLMFFVVSLYGQEINPQNEKSKKLYEEFNDLNKRLQVVQQQALADEKLTKKSQEFADKVEAEMIKKDPSVKEKLDERDAIIDDFQKAEETGNQEEIAKLQQKYQVIAQELQVHQRGAMQNEQIMKEGQELENSMLDKMEEIDPEVLQLIARLEQINQELQGMQKN